MIGYIKEKLKKVFLGEASPERCALASAFGAFIGFSPYLGIQTVLVILLGQLMKLNIPIAFTISCLVNNPWTMGPIVILNYAVGTWVIKLLHLDLSSYEPAFMQTLTTWLAQKLTPYVASAAVVEKLSFWPYFIGGHVVGLVAAFVAYFLSKKLFARFTSAQEHSEKRDTV